MSISHPFPTRPERPSAQFLNEPRNRRFDVLEGQAVWPRGGSPDSVSEQLEMSRVPVRHGDDPLERVRVPGDPCASGWLHEGVTCVGWREGEREVFDGEESVGMGDASGCLLYTSPSPRD